MNPYHKIPKELRSKLFALGVRIVHRRRPGTWTVYSKGGGWWNQSFDTVQEAEAWGRGYLALATEAPVRSKLVEFAELVSRMWLTGELDQEGEPYMQDVDDAVSTLGDLIASARKITGVKPDCVTGMAPTCYLCEHLILDPEHRTDGYGPRHLNACPV